MEVNIFLFSSSYFIFRPVIELKNLLFTQLNLK